MALHALLKTLMIFSPQAFAIDIDDMTVTGVGRVPSSSMAALLDEDLDPRTGQSQPELRLSASEKVVGRKEDDKA